MLTRISPKCAASLINLLTYKLINSLSLTSHLINIKPLHRKISFPYFLILFFLNNSFSNAQVRWHRVDTGFGQLPPSIKLFKSTDSLNGRPFIGWYLEADLNDRQLDFTTQVGAGKRYTPSEYFTREDSPYVVVNGTYFSFQTNQNLNLVIRHGRLVAYNIPTLKTKGPDSLYYPTRSAIGIRRNRRADVAWTFTDTAKRWPYAFQEKPIVARGNNPTPTINDLNTLEHWKWWRMQTAIGGGPVLVKDFQPIVTNKEEQIQVNGENDRHPRTAMGYTAKGKLIILVIQGRFPGVAEGATLNEEANILALLGCKEALNLDGGGSSCMLVNGKETITPSDKAGQQRPVPGVFIIRQYNNN